MIAFGYILIVLNILSAIVQAFCIASGQAGIFNYMLMPFNVLTAFMVYGSLQRLKATSELRKSLEALRKH